MSGRIWFVRLRISHQLLILGLGSVLIAPDPGALRGYLEGLGRLRVRAPRLLAPGHGPLVREVEAVTAEIKVLEVHIEAGTGSVIDVEEEKPEQDMKRERKGGHQP